MEEKKKRQRLSKHANKIDLPFEEAVRRLVNFKPKPKPKRDQPENKPKE